MPAYKFEALDAAGKASTGLLEADNAKAARAQLRAQALDDGAGVGRFHDAVDRLPAPVGRPVGEDGHSVRRLPA